MRCGGAGLELLEGDGVGVSKGKRRTGRGCFIRNPVVVAESSDIFLPVKST